MFSCGYACTDIPQGTFPSFIVVIGKDNSFFASMETTEGWSLQLFIWWVELKGEKRQGCGQQWLLRSDAVSLHLTLKPMDHCGPECLLDGTSWDGLGITHNITLSLVCPCFLPTAGCIGSYLQFLTSLLNSLTKAISLTTGMKLILILTR